MRTRLLALVPLAVLALSTAGHAAPTKVPQVVDPKGDAPSGASQDVLSVLYTTAGTGTGKAYRPTKVVVTMTLAGPAAGPGYTYEAQAMTDTCGEVTFTAEPGTPYGSVTGLNGWVEWGDCTVGDDSDVELITAALKGSTIVWTVGIKASPLEVGTVFTDFVARVDPSNPLVPFPSSLTGTELGLLDAASGKGSWKVG